MSGFKWEAARKKSANRLKGTIPATDYELSGDGFVCVIHDKELSPESRKKSNRLADLLRHIKCERFAKKSVQQQIDVVREIYSHHMTLFFYDESYYASKTHRHARLVLQSYEH